MSSRATIILVTNIIAFILITPLTVFAIASVVKEDPNILGFAASFILALLIFFILWFVSNKLISNSVKGTYITKQNEELAFKVDKPYKELVLNINYEIKNFKISVVKFNYEGELLRDGVVVKKISFGTSNLGSGMAPDNAELQLSAYYKNDEQIIIEDPQSGNYVLKSNKESAPDQITIKEEYRLFE